MVQRSWFLYSHIKKLPVFILLTNVVQKYAHFFVVVNFGNSPLVKVGIFETLKNI
jgi:hypothetical protein